VADVVGDLVRPVEAGPDPCVDVLKEAALPLS
jgi:hypothetical protein